MSDNKETEFANFVESIKHKQNQIKKYKEEIQDEKQIIIEKYAPFKIGDWEECNGFAFSGKTIVVESINIKTNFHGDIIFIGVGSVLKNDGTPSNRNIGSITSKTVFTVQGLKL